MPTLRELHKALREDGAPIPENYGDFELYMTTGPQNGYAHRKEVYDALKADGAPLPDTYEEFSKALFYPVKSNGAKPAAKPQGTVAAAKPQGTVAAAGTPLSDEDKRRMSAAVGSMVNAAQAGNKRAMNRMDYAQANTGIKVKPVKLGENRHVVETTPKYNLETGKQESTYITESGNEFENRSQADLEQNAIDEYKYSQTVEGQLREAEAESERLSELMRQRMEEIDSNREGGLLRELADESHGMPGGMVNSNGMNDYRTDERFLQLEAAARKNRLAIQTLKDKRDGKMNDFWHSLGTAMLNGYTLSDGLSDMNDATAVLSAQKRLDAINRKREAGQPLTKEEEAAEAVLRNFAINEQIQGQYGGEYGAWSRAGSMAATSIDLMKDIMLTPGAGGIAKGVAAKTAQTLGKGVSKVAGEKVANNIITKGILKGTGILVGAHTAGAVVSNTGGIGHTGAAMGREMAGNVTIDDNGNYGIENQKDLLHAFVEAERQQAGENGSEMFGEFIPGAGGLVKKGLEKIGLSKISNALTNIGKKNWYKQYSNLLSSGGYNGIPGEAIEEYEGMLFDAMTGNAGEAWENIKDPRTHIDIWLGCATMGALLGAVPMTVQGAHTAQYYRYKHKADVADKVASYRMTSEKWEPIREQIDMTENGGMTDVVMDIANRDDLHVEEKKAAIDYVRNLMKMRGYNIAQANNANEDKDADVETANEEYSEGYGATGREDMRDVKNRYDLHRERVSDLVDDGMLTMLDSDPVNALSLIRDNDAWTDEEKQVLTDYVNAKAAYDGMLQGVRDDIDSRMAQSDAMVNSRVNPADGMLHPAKMKENDREVYVIGGNIVMNDDGTMIDNEKSDESIIVRDAETGKIEFADPRSVLSIDTALDAEQVKQEARENIRQSTAQQAANNIDGILPFNAGDNYTLTDEQGQQHTVTVVPVPEGMQLNDGDVLVSYDGVTMPMPRDYIQNGVENTNLARLTENETERAARLAAEPQGTVDSRPVYSLNDEITLQTDEGPVRGSITAEENEDGLIEVYTERPVGGNKINLYNRDELDGMLIEQNGATLPQSIDPAAKPQGTVDAQPSGEADETVVAQSEVQQVEPMPMVGEGEEAEPDFTQATPQRAHTYIYNEAGLDRDEANQFVEANKKAADKALSTIQGKKPKMGTSLAKYRKETAEWQQNVAEAQAQADYWKQVKDEQQKILAAEVQARAERDAAIHEQAIAEEQLRQEEELRKREEQAQLGSNNVAPQISEKWNAAPKVEGARNELVLANGEKVAGRYVLVESGAATPSHNPVSGFAKNEGFPVDENEQSVNDRDYERDQDAQAITRQIAGSYDSRALQTPVVVSSDGVVLSGNGRTMAGELAAMDGTDGAYIEYLKKYGEQYGFTPEQIEGMAHPRVLFVPDEAMPYTADTFAKFNQQEMKGQSKTEQAVKLGKIVDDDTFGRIIRSMNAYETLGDFYSDPTASANAIQELLKAGAISQAQYAEMFDGDTISSQGREMLENMLIGKAFESNPDAVREITAYKSMRQSIICALSEISNNLLLGDDYSLESELAQAIELVYKARQAGYKSGERVSSYARQLNLFPFEDGESVADYTNTTTLMLADVLNDSRVTRLKKVLAIYNHNAQDSANGQMNLFTGGVESKEEILNTVKSLLYNGTEEQQQAAINEAVEQRTAAAEQSGTGSGAQQDGVGSGRSGGIEYEGGSGGSSEETQRLNHNEAISLIAQMEERAEVAPQIELTIENWDAQFGEDGRVNTPIGEVKMGENQFAKLMRQGREGKLGMIKPTLESPDVIIEDASKAKDSDTTERNSSYIFVKAFKKADGSRYYYFTSITVNKEGNEVVVSSQEKSRNRLLRLMTEGKMLWRTPNDATTASVEQQGLDYAQPLETETATKGSGITPQSSNMSSSDGKGTKKSRNNNELDEKNTEKEKKSTSIAKAEAETEQNPTDGQKEAGNYKKGHVKIDGFDISIENPKGSERSGTDASGKPWSVTMNNTYGYIRRTEGVDGDHIDVFLSDHIDDWNGMVYVVDQINENGSFDEHKVMYGFNSEEEARDAYLSNYSEGWQGLGAITGVSKDEFKKWIDSSHRKTKAFAEYAMNRVNGATKAAGANDDGKSVRSGKSSRKGKNEATGATKANSGQFGLVSDARMAELKERLRQKMLGQMNMGIDPEILTIGIELTAGHIDRGIKAFADYAKAMIEDLGDAIRPYLKAFYNGARDLPEIIDSGLAEEMTPYDEVRMFDVANFDKQHKDAMATAEQVVAEQEAQKQAEEAVKKLKSEKKSDIKAKSQKKVVTLQQEGDLFGTSTESEEEADVNEVAKREEKPEVSRKFSMSVKNDMLVSLDNGTKPYRSIVDLRKKAKEVGLDVDDDGRTDILLQELVEDGLVRAAREVTERVGNDSKEAYDLICKLYEMQPTIAARSSNRIKMGQYSTPLPMAWNADRFAMHGKEKGEVLEPTAGNGMLVFAVPAGQVHVNELDETRLANLREQGFAQVTQQDAVEPFEGGKKYDAIISNPPFGKLDAASYDGKSISGLDPHIALNALASMKDDGRAAIIIGGNMEYAKNGALRGMKPFFTYLYDHYNVKGVVDMDGKLFAKQGTTYPTRMILIDGRRSEEERSQSKVYPPVKEKAVRKADSFEELYNIVYEIINSKDKTNGTEILRSQQGQLSVVDNQPSRKSDREGHRKQSGKNDGDGRRGTGAGSKPQTDTGGSQPILPGEHRENSGDGENRGRVGGSPERRAGGNSEPVVRGMADVGVSKDGVGLTPSTQERQKRNLTDEKSAYRPHNSAFSLESVAPSAMVEAMDKVLSEIEKKEGSIDEFVTKELGYDSVEEAHNALAAEQMDSVAMAIYQMKQGQALIIGDQTGVGKGRQMAALIRWAVKRGEKPIFITQKADLFSDIYRDLVDVGSGDLVPFIFNSDGAMVDSNGNTVHKPLSSQEMAKVFATGKFPEEYDFAVLTYSQVNTGDEVSQKEFAEAAKKSGARVKKSKNAGKATPKATFLRALAKDNYLFLDESHTAAGYSNTGAYLQSILRTARAATFASATFAKRPDTMPLYAIRTAMSQANVDQNKLIEIIEKGGVTLQEIMSRELTNAGQMVRRERDMSDVKTDWKTIDYAETVRRARENYDKTITAFNAIIKFQEDYVKPMIENLDKELAIMAESAGVKRGTDKMGVDNVPFASKTYNYTKQLMLALKVDAIADEVEAEIKAGRHPVIALESTMEISIKDYAAGETIDEPTFSASLLKGLDTVMQYTIKDEDGNKTHARYTPSQLGEAGEKAYYDLVKLIRESTSDIYISPLDAIIDRLHEKGYKVGELTGRSMYVERDENGKAVVRRRTDKDKKRMQREFNSGELDVLILNKSASTGISLHASEKFSDQRQRSMIIAQPLSDINDYMQMIGRIDRTGQVHRGYYINLGLPVPAENRFLMMLSTKLKSLNANTTTSQDSESNDVEAPDLLNKYGSQVVIEYLRDNPEVYDKMGQPLKKSQGAGKVQSSELDEYKSQEDDARKITGYVALLSTKEQEEFYDDVVRRYNELIKYLNDTGNNDLKITVMPLRAKTVEKKVSSVGVDPEGSNPFARNSYVEQVEMDVLRKPMKADDVRKTISQVCKGKTPQLYKADVLRIIDAEDMARLDAEAARYERAKEKARADIAKQTEKINAQKKRTAEEKATAIADYTAETNERVESKHDQNVQRIKSNNVAMKRALNQFEVGKSYLVPDNLESIMFDFAAPAIFCGYKTKDSKITASTTLAVFATLDGRRRVEVKLSQTAALMSITKMTNDNWDAARSTTLDNWDSQIPTESRKTGYIMTGNILQAIADTQDKRGAYPGQLISYTDIDGNVHDGILMPDKWNASMLKGSGAPIAARLTQIKDYQAVESSDGKVEITGNRWAEQYYLTVPSTKKDGAIFFENNVLLNAAEGHNFYPYRGKLRADIKAKDITKVVTELSKLGVKVGNTENNTNSERMREGDEFEPMSYDESLMWARRAGYSKRQHDARIERTKRHMREQAENAISRLGLTGRVTVLETAEGLKGRKARAKGWYDAKTGKIVVVMSNHHGPIDIMRTILHEGVAHYGLRALFGSNFDRFLDNVFQYADASVRSRIVDLAKRHGWDFRVATEEYLASLAEDTDFERADRQGWWSRIKSFFLDMLHSIGLDYGGAILTDNELRYILWRSYENLAEPGTYRNLFAEAADVSMQARLKVGNYAEPLDKGTGNVAEETVMRDVNERFNRELSRYHDGVMDKSEMLHLGKPQGVVRQFLPDLPIVMRQRILNKGSVKKHNVDVAALANMPQHLSSPIFIFQRSANTLGVLTEMQDRDGKNVCVAIELNREIQNGGEILEVNDIRSVHGRNVADIVYPIVQNGTLKWADKEKGLAYLSSASRYVQQEIDKQDLDSAAKVIENFENPKVSEENFDDDDEIFFRSADVDMMNDTARAAYDARMAKTISKVREAWQDGMTSVNALQEEVLKQRGETLVYNEDSYRFENQMHGINRNKAEYFERALYKPIIEALNKLCKQSSKTVEEVMDYMMAKHGLERNVVMAERAAQEDYIAELQDNPFTTKTLQDFIAERRKRDYGGLTGLFAVKPAAKPQGTVAAAETKARQMVDAMEQSHGTLTNELWAAVNAATSWTLRQSYESGEMTREQYNDIRSMYKNYIPLRGWDEVNAHDVYDYVKNGAGGYDGVVKTAHGRGSKADNPIAHIGSMGISSIIGGSRNMLKRHLFAFAVNHPSSLLTVSQQWYRNYGTKKKPDWRVELPDIPENATADEISDILDQFEKDMEQLEQQGIAKKEKSGLSINYRATSQEKKQHTVQVRINGKDYVIYVNGNPRAAQAINGDLQAEARKASQESSRLAEINRWMAENFTSKNPAFIFSNAARDITMAMTVVGIKENGEYNKRFYKNLLSVYRPRIAKGGALMPNLMSKYKNGTLDTRNEVERYFKEFMDRGAETGFTSLRDVEEYKKRMAKELARMNDGKVNPKKALRAMGDIFEHTNRCVEDATRFVTYMTSRQMGRNVSQSVDDAKNVTLNFNRKGSGAMGNATFRNLYIFVNPAIQSLQLLGKLAKEHPVKTTLATAIFITAGAMMPMLNLLIMSLTGGDDDDYWNLPAWVRRNNLVVKFPYTENFVTIPLAQEFRVFYGLGECATACMLGHGGEHPAMEVRDQFLDLLPLSFTGAGGNVAVNFAPTLLQPLMQLDKNIDFTGKPIWRENQGNEYEPSFQKAYSGTPKWLVKSSELLNDVTGGDAHRRGWIERNAFGRYANNPAIVNHLLKGYFGGMYTFVAQSAGAMTTAMSGESPKVQEIPIANRFVNRPMEREQSLLGEEYWNLVEKRDEYRNSYNKWSKDADNGIDGAKEKISAMEKTPEYKRYDIENDIIKDIEKMRTGLKNEQDEKTSTEMVNDIKSLLEELRKVHSLNDRQLETLYNIEDGDTYIEIVSLDEKSMKERLDRMHKTEE